MSRLSSDISTIDAHLPVYVQFWFLVVAPAIVNLVLMVYVIWWLVFVQLFVLVVYQLLQVPFH